LINSAELRIRIAEAASCQVAAPVQPGIKQLPPSSAAYRRMPGTQPGPRLTAKVDRSDFSPINILFMPQINRFIQRRRSRT
jgi:hypothetical protein